MSKQPDLGGVNAAAQKLTEEVQKVTKDLPEGEGKFSSTTTEHHHSSTTTHDSVSTHNGVVTHEEHTTTTTGNTPDQHN